MSNIFVIYNAIRIYYHRDVVVVNNFKTTTAVNRLNLNYFYISILRFNRYADRFLEPPIILRINTEHFGVFTT